jgi:hypothetical protein
MYIQRNFTILSYFSMLGVAGVVYTSGFMLFRKLEGSYAPGGAFFKAIPKVCRVRVSGFVRD